MDTEFDSRYGRWFRCLGLVLTAIKLLHEQTRQWDPGCLPLGNATPHEPPHLFNCLATPTSLTVIDLAANPVEAANILLFVVKVGRTFYFELQYSGHLYFMTNRLRITIFVVVSSYSVVLFDVLKRSRKKVIFLLAGPLKGGGGKALMAQPLRK